MSELLADFFTKGQLANELGCAPATLDRWERLKKGPPKTKIGQLVLYRRADVAAWLAAAAEAAAAPATNRRRTGAAR
jgi:predicted DNA-binding transcriptional regulator AlpA